MNCPIPRCVLDVAGPLRLCSNHFKLVPRPQQDALAHYARAHKGGPAHRAAFERAVESVRKTLEFHKSLSWEQPAALPVRGGDAGVPQH